jgi:polyhydroxyalkanoate synthesis regulator phasin
LEGDPGWNGFEHSSDKERGRIEMDQETKEYLDRKLLVLVKRDDVEKLRQEIKASFRQLKDESRTQILEVIQELKADLERWMKEEKQERDFLRNEFKEKLGKWNEETRPLLDQWNQGLVSSLKQMGEEMQSIVAHSELEMGRTLQVIREEEVAQRTRFGEEWKAEIDRLTKGSEEIGDKMKQMAEESSSLYGKIKEGLTEMKEELGAMLKFSFADLEKRIGALETRIKALEKMVFH